jgi:hypothetical protein
MVSVLVKESPGASKLAPSETQTGLHTVCHSPLISRWASGPHPPMTVGLLPRLRMIKSTANDVISGVR